jgi:RimJ/RimL family protein N-acetyltransferase
VLTFERTHDLSLVRRILTDPAVWPHVGDDFAPPRKEWHPNSDDRIWYVLAIEKTRLIGLFTFAPRSTVLWEAHVVFMPGRRSRGVNIVEQMFAWMFEHSTAERIIAEIPALNRLAVKLASKTMTPYGVNERAWMKGGTLQDLVLFGVSKGDICRA